MRPQRCQNCIYAVRPAGTDKAILVCTNKEDSAGRLFVAERQGWCRNFQGKRVVNRAEVKQPENDEIRLIALTQGKVAIVDKEDYEWLSRYKWYASESGGKFYACRKNRRAVYMHREIVGAPKGMVVDHIDGNELNNRRSNLRVCTVSQNHQNRRRTGGRSKYKGVHLDKKLNKWVAAITLKGRYFHIGYFDDEREAARAYDKKATALFGEFAYLNFPPETHPPE